MSLPDRATKHIPKPQASIGAQRKGKLKVIDGKTGRESWRQGRTGFIKDADGDPISKAPAGSGVKNRPSHSVRMGIKHKSHRPSSGRPTHQAGQSSSDSDE